MDLHNKTIIIHEQVPRLGITCSNRERLLRLASLVNTSKKIESSWGIIVVFGEYKGIELFLALAPVGSGSGVVYTELYYRGAECIVRIGSDDVLQPEQRETRLLKIVNRADGLYGYAKAIGFTDAEMGAEIQASNRLITALVEQAERLQIEHEMRICHHLEAYHTRDPEAYPIENRERILAEKQQREIVKPFSTDMETAVLFATAKLFAKHAATVLVTVDKEKPREPYSVNTLVYFDVETLFFDVVVEALKSLQ
jgi:uridine phosphorylase